MNNNVSLLQSFILTAVTASDSAITEEKLFSMAKQIRESMKTLYPVSDEEFAYIIRKIQEKLPVKMDVGFCIQDRRNNYTPWYRGRISSIQMAFWNRFRQYLLVEKMWTPAVVNTIDKVSDQIVELLGDPQSEQPFSRKGLVLGDVQSGKTVNFTAICNKAVDAGYRIVILLAGTIETLRKQTQDRMDLEFAGINSYNQFHKIHDDLHPGVSRFDSNALVVSFTTNISDFKAAALQSNNMSLHTVDPKVPIFFVVKKNVSILMNLLEWLRYPQNIGPHNRIDLPVLVLDDEADNASINSNDEDSDPTKTNARIRELLTLFSKVSYLAITATPFANIFIDPDTVDEMYEDDLFPRDFIYALSPPTSDQPLRSYNAYIGAAQIFGDPPLGNMLISLSDIEDALPKSHKSSSLFTYLPDSLKEAIAYFCLANVVRDIRGDTTAHRSMLIHISHFKNLHKQIEEQVSLFFNAIKYAVLNYAALPIEESMKIPEIQFLKTVWDKYDFRSLTNRKWEYILSKKIYKSIASIVVQIVNSSGGVLDYAGNKKDGLRVIAIGGNCLSRGLTLEGLMVSYFRRNTMMYDTLLQMGRWFGFRPSYADLCKIWLTDEVREWFEQITESYTELKNDIYMMQEQGKSPKDFGLKVRMHPGSLLPTARNKMRNGIPLKRPITISGRLLETPRLRVDSLHQNEIAIRDFVSNLSQNGIQDPETNALLWHKVSSDLVATLLRNFPTDPWNLMFRGNDIAKYIDQHPQEWDVALMTGDGSEYTFQTPNGALTIKSEGRFVEQSGNVYKIMGSKLRVGAGGASKVGLTREQIKQISDSYKVLNPGKNVPDDEFFKIQRPPILMIHVIERKDMMPGNFLYAIGTGFPGDKEKEEYADYYVDLVEWRQYNEEQSESNNADPTEVQ